MQLSDVMIHINEQVDTNQQYALETTIRKVEGVVAPRFNQPHLFLVSYNPEKTSSSSILHVVQKSGYTAQLVGI